MSLDALEPLLDAVTLRQHQEQLKRRLPQSADQLRLLVLRDGHLDYQVEDHCYHLQRGHCLVLRADENQRMLPDDKSSHKLLEINFPSALGHALETGGQLLMNCFLQRPAGRDNRMPLNNRQTNALLERCERFIEGRIDPLTQTKSPLAVLHHLSGILLLIDAAWNRQSRPGNEASNPLVQKALDYIMRELVNPVLSLKDCAAEIGCTPTYLSRIFREETGRGFKHYVLTLRIARAKHALRHGASVTDACYDSGFNDYANFVKRFSQRCGVSPGRFRVTDLPPR